MALKSLDWQGPLVIEQIAQRLIGGVNTFNEQVASDARASLYPGHGVDTGELKSSIQVVPARWEGNRIIGTIGAYGVKYSLMVHEKYYPFLRDPLLHRQGGAVGMITQA